MIVTIHTVWRDVRSLLFLPYPLSSFCEQAYEPLSGDHNQQDIQANQTHHHEVRELFDYVFADSIAKQDCR